MKTARKLLGSMLFVVAPLLLAANSAQAGVSCHRIDAKGVGQDLGGGVTEADVIGGGLLNGTTLGSFSVVGGAPPVFAVAGTVTFTARKATLTVSLEGTFNVATGDFLTTGPVSGSTGKLSGATGSLTLDGTQDLLTGEFEEDITGVICVDLAP